MIHVPAVMLLFRCFFCVSFFQDCDSELLLPVPFALKDVAVGLLTVSSSHAPPTEIDLQPSSTAIIIEGSVVVDDLQDLPQAMCLLFGLVYGLNLSYPKAMVNTMNFIQRVMLGLGSEKLSARLQSLKNLLSY